MLNATKRKTNHRAVVDVRIKLVLEFTIPAPGLTFRFLNLPIAKGPHLLLQAPISELAHARTIPRNARLAHGKQSVSRIPHRRHAGLHAEGVFFFDPKLLEFIDSTN